MSKIPLKYRATFSNVNKRVPVHSVEFSDLTGNHLFTGENVTLDLSGILQSLSSCNLFKLFTSQTLRGVQVRPNPLFKLGLPSISWSRMNLPRKKQKITTEGVIFPQKFQTRNMI